MPPPVAEAASESCTLPSHVEPVASLQWGSDTAPWRVQDDDLGPVRVRVSSIAEISNFSAFTGSDLSILGTSCQSPGPNSFSRNSRERPADQIKFSLQGELMHAFVCYRVATGDLTPPCRPPTPSSTRCLCGGCASCLSLSPSLSPPPPFTLIPTYTGLNIYRVATEGGSGDDGLFTRTESQGNGAKGNGLSARIYARIRELSLDNEQKHLQLPRLPPPINPKPQTLHPEP